MTTNTLVLKGIVAALSATLLANTAMAASGVDITSQKGITIGGAIGGAGGKFVAWGGSVALTDSDAFLQSNGHCAFNVNYDIKNAGDTASDAPYKNWIVANGSTVAINGMVTANGLQALAAGQTKQVSTQPYLPIGSYDLRVKLDVENAIAETNETNNDVGIHVVLTGTCGATSTATTTATTTTTTTTRTTSTTIPPTTRPEPKIDLVSQKGVTIGGVIGGAGGKFVPWGASVVLSDADSYMQSNGRCAFNVNYDMANTGNTATAVQFKNQLATGGTAVAINSGLSLNAGESKQISTQAYLPIGTYDMSLRLDSENTIVETNEANNTVGIKVTMAGLCGVKPPEPKADLVSQKGITIGGALGAVGGKSSSWGGTLILHTADAFMHANGKCAFNISYDMENVGAGAAGPAFVNQIFSGTALVSQQTGLSLDKGAIKQINSQTYLSPGTNLVKLVLDGANNVAESNEANNTTQLNVIVDSTCQAETTTSNSTTTTTKTTTATTSPTTRK